MTTERVVVYVKPGCHLCEDACAVVADVAARCGVGWRAQDISGDPQLLAQWAEFVPVVVVDGAVHGWFRVRPERLQAVLATAPPA